ncbi:MAG: glycosyltransferase [Dysgonamonadaceae bacterium]|jgi:glycosyltransferase involved in cell wall biosynthesis|nr:glycosyltransferase [Dysgonamonadaceae bacterium]
MKILHVIYSFNTGGAETMLVDIINQQCKTEPVNLLIVNDKFNRSLLETIDKRVEVFLIDRKEGNKLHLFSAFWKTNALLRKIRPDVIHCHDGNLFPFFAKWRKKTCLTVHNVNLSALFFKYFEKVFSISSSVREDVKKRTGIDAETVYNGIEVENYLPRTDYNFLPEKEPFKIILVSRLFPAQKGQYIAVEALRLLSAQYPNINLQLVFVGTGEALEMLRNSVAQKNVEKYVVFHGQADRLWIKENLKNFHLLIQPSLYEGFGLTVVEGFAAGLPVIASDVDGPKEILSVLKAGLRVEVGNPRDLADKIYQIYTAYVSGNLLNHNYVITDKTNLRMFDIHATAFRYLALYRKFSL